MAYLLSYGVGLLNYILVGLFFYIWCKSLSGIQAKSKIQTSIVLVIASAILYAVSFLPNKIIAFPVSIIVLLLMGTVLFTKEYKIVLFYTLTYCAFWISIYSIVELILELPITILILGVLCIVMAKCVGTSSKAYAVIKAPVISILPAVLTVLEIIICSAKWMNREALYYNEVLVSISVAGIVSLVVLTYAIRRFSETISEAEEMRLLAIKDDIEKKHYQNMEEQHEEYDVIIHDLKHVIRTMAILSSGDNSAEVVKLVEKIDLSIGKISDKEYCSNKILNALLLERVGFAEEKGVELDLNIVEPLQLSRIEDLDLITMMGNLLDNAIIAESKVKNPKDVFCRVALSKDFEHILIQVENSYEGKAFKAKLKPEGSLGAKHGIGLRSIEEIVRKYGGIMDSSIDNGRYWIKIVIPT